MTAAVFAKGFAIGLSIAAPVGPIGLLCIRRSLAEGPKTGFVVGLGAATADAAYGAVAAFGLTAISSFLVNRRASLSMFGGLFLCYLGARTFFADPPGATPTPGKPEAGKLAPAYASTFVLTLTNPATILSFVAIFAGLGLAGSSNFISATALVVGVFLGSAVWWLFLSQCVGRLHERITSGWMSRINKLSGLILFAFGFWAMLCVVEH